MPKPRVSYRKEVRSILIQGIEELKARVTYPRLIAHTLEKIAQLYVGRSEEALRLIAYEELQALVAGGGLKTKRLKAGVTYTLTGKPVEVAERSFGNLEFGKGRKKRKPTQAKMKAKRKSRDV